MRALQFSRTGSLEALSLVELPQPLVAEGEVLIRVEAAGLNPSDVKNVFGRFPYTTLPRVPGRDFAGVVVEGPAHLLGQAVWGTGRGPGFLRDGSHATYMTLPAEGVALKPQALSFAQAASLGVPYTTAWDALERCDVQAGTRLLVIGANGAVGQAAMALARARGAEAVGAVRRAEQVERLAGLGHRALLLAQPEQLGGQVQEVFEGGAEVIFDTTGFWLPAATSALADFGRIAIIAAPVDGHVQLPALALYRKGGSIVGVNSLLYDTRACARMLEHFGHLFDEGRLPLPQDVLEAPLADALSHYHAVHEGSSAKIVLIP